MQMNMPRPDSDAGLLSCNPFRVVLFLGFISTFIVLVGAISNLSIYLWLGEEHVLSNALRRFDLVNEPSLPSWYSSLLLISCAVLLAIIAVSELRNTKPLRVYWCVLASLFACLALDEAVMIHEMADAPVREYLGTSGIFTIAWIIPGSIFAAFVALCYVPFLRGLDVRSRWLFVCAGGVFLSGAVIMEIPGGLLYEKYGFSTWHYIASYAIEEWLEMTGILIFIYALLDYIRKYVGRITLDLRSSSPVDSKLSSH